MTQGHALVTIECLNFGLLESWQDDHPLHQIDINSKSGKKLRKFKAVERPVRPHNPSSRPSIGMVTQSLRTAGQKRIQGLLDDISAAAGMEDPVEVEEIASLAIPEETVQPEPILWAEKKGTLERQLPVPSAPFSGSNKKTKLSKRWFVLKEGTFSCYKTAKEKNPTDQMSLEECKISQDDRAVIVRCTRLRWDLLASSAGEAEEWVAALRKNSLLALQESIPWSETG